MYTPPITAITSTLGDNKGGFINIRLMPRQYLNSPIIPNPKTLVVDSAIDIITGNSFITITCQTESIGLEETAKDSRAGFNWEQKLTFIINKDEADKNIALNTLSLHELIVIAPDKNGNTKVIGNIDYGMIWRHKLKVEEDTAGKSYYDVELTCETEAPAPFYTA